MGERFRRVPCVTTQGTAHRPLTLRGEFDPESGPDTAANSPRNTPARQWRQRRAASRWVVGIPADAGYLVALNPSRSKIRSSSAWAMRLSSTC